jgi:predicted nucleic acid-binding protein
VKYVLDTNAVSRVLDGDERALGALPRWSRKTWGSLC